MFKKEKINETKMSNKLLKKTTLNKFMTIWFLLNKKGYIWDKLNSCFTYLYKQVENIKTILFSLTNNISKVITIMPATVSNTK